MMVVCPKVDTEELVRRNWIWVAFFSAKWYCLIHRVEKGKGKVRKITPVESNCLTKRLGCLLRLRILYRGLRKTVKV